MFPSGFAEENGVLGAPAGMTPDECEPLSVWRGANDLGAAVVVSCWKVTPEELREIEKTGRVWLVVLGQTMPPVVVLGTSPFCAGG